MAEVQSSRPSTRGRGSSRGRGGYSSRGRGRQTTKHTNGDTADTTTPMSVKEQGELGQLKKKYQTELPLLKDVFPDWSDEDLVFAIQESNGDVQSTIEKIAEGNVSQFTDVKKKPRDKPRAKASNDAYFLAPGDAETKNPTGRAGRGRGGAETGRGGRGRGSERGRGGARGGRGGSGAAINGSRTNAPEATLATADVSGGWDSQPAAATSGWDTQDEAAPATGGWDTTATDQEAAPGDAWGDTAPADTAPTTAAEVPKSSLIPQGSTKSWASMLAKPKAAPAPRKSAASPAAIAQPEEQIATEEIGGPSMEAAPAIEEDQWASQQPQDSWSNESPTSNTVDDSFGAASTTTAELTPPKDPLTEDNVESLPDNSGPIPTETVASTRGDDRSAIGGSTPSYAAGQQAPIGRPGLGGFATSAQKAANVSGRSMSYQRLKEQQDAVVMPGNHAVDRAAVQFGQMGLGSGEAGGPQDVDDEREDAETRAQPPQQSPSQPRAALPPAPRSYQIPTDHAPQENVPTPRQAPGLPMPGQHQASMGGQPTQAHGAPGLGQPGADNQSYGPYGRYGGSAFSQDHGAPPQKEYDPFSTQLNPSSHHEQRNAYGGISQAPGQSSHPTQSYAGGYSQASGDYSSQYATDQPQGNYSSYYGSGGYGQPATSSMSENVPPQRSASGFSTQDARYGSNPSHPSQSHYNEGQASGNNTPNPNAHGPQGQHGQSGYGGGQQYGGPGYYSGYGGYGQSNYGQGYNQYSGYNQGGYNSGGYGTKSGMYGGGASSGHGYPNNYGAGAGAGSYDQHSSSPATSGAFGSSSVPTAGRESGMSSNPLADYSTGRSGSTQPSSAATPGGYGGMGDNNPAPSSYGAGARSTSGFGSHANNSQNYGHNQSYGGGAGPDSGNADPLKGLHDPKSGPVGGRPGSAFNAGQHGSYGPQGGHGGFGGHNQYGGSGYGGGAGGSGIGGLGGHGAPGGAAGGYGQGAFGGGTGTGAGGYGGRGGGWASQYAGGAGNYGH